MSRTIYLIRHFKPACESKILLGHSNPDLEQKSIPQIKMYNENFQKFCEGLKIFSSDLNRAKQTANHLFKDREITYNQQLREINFGDFERYSWPEIEIKYPDFYESYMNDWYDKEFPNGESYKQLKERTKDFLRLNMDHDRLCIVCHAGAIRSLIENLTNVSVNDIFALKIGYGEMIKLVQTNEIFHIEKQKPVEDWF